MDTRPECASTKPASSAVSFFLVLCKIMTEGRWVDKKRYIGGQKKEGGGQKRRLHLQRGGRPVNLIGGNTNSDDGLRRIAST